MGCEGGTEKTLEETDKAPTHHLWHLMRSCNLPDPTRHPFLSMSFLQLHNVLYT